MGSPENAESEIAVAGEMTTAERGICQNIQAKFSAVLEGRLDFFESVKLVWRALHALQRREFDMQAAMSQLDERQVSTNPAVPASQLTPRQGQFIRDINGMIDFAIRNGWGFPTVLSILGHDLSDLLHYDADLERAAADCWEPKASGWAKMNAAEFGQSDEQGE